MGKNFDGVDRMNYLVPNLMLYFGMLLVSLAIIFSSLSVAWRLGLLGLYIAFISFIIHYGITQINKEKSEKRAKQRDYIR